MKSNGKFNTRILLSSFVFSCLLSCAGSKCEECDAFIDPIEDTNQTDDSDDSDAADATDVRNDSDVHIDQDMVIDDGSESEDQPLDTDPCSGVTCSDHGTCSVVDGEPFCTCTEGYFSICGMDCVEVDVIVAASDSSAEDKALADHVCSGESDNETINSAINATPEGGTTLLLPGTYSCTGNVVPKSGTSEGKTRLQGSCEDSTVLTFSEGNLVIDRNYVEVSDLRLMSHGSSTSQKGLCKVEGAKHVALNRITSYRIDRWGTASFWMTLPSGTVTEDVEFNYCKAIEGGGFGFLAMKWGSSPGSIRNVRFNYCEAIRSGSYIPEGETLPVTYYGPASNLHSESWVTGFDVNENGPAEDVTFTGCLAEESWESGFHMEPETSGAYASNIRFVDCTARNNGQKYWLDDPAHPDYGIDRYMLADPVNGFGYTEWKVDFGAGFVITADATMTNCTSEGNVVGVMASCNGAGDITGFADNGSKVGVLLHNSGQCSATTPHFAMTGSSLTDNVLPVQLWRWASEDAVFDDITISSGSPSSNAAVDARSSQTHGELITIQDSSIENYDIGVRGRSSYPINVDNVCVTGASDDFVNCTIISACGG